MCTTLVLAAGLAVVWARVVQTLTESSGAPKTIGQPGALVWDGRVFTSSGQLKAYLASQGLSYSRWLARHPTAFGGSAPTAIKHSTAKKHAATAPSKTAAKPATHHVAAPQPATATTPKSLISTVLTILLLIGGVILGGSAVLPRRFAPASLTQFYAAPDRRMVAIAAATAILLGLGVSFYLT